jgi:hypothetical protein
MLLNKAEEIDAVAAEEIDVVEMHLVEETREEGSKYLDKRNVTAKKNKI